ncbi:M23 family metallopeptidase [Flavobacterium sp. PLA-1-15]|uniref:M23 family metallopeptidase n=1 Tax=Flavobacterium sp. PLA-1-15 TaxID=3380533 RepID=UPI003B80EA3E
MKTKTILISLGVATAFFLLSTKKAFANLVHNQGFRGCDGFGCGSFGASRGDRVHQGIDIPTVKGETIFSPISGTVTRFPFPYGDDLRYTGIEIKNEIYSVKIFYLKATVPAGAIVKQGQAIATAQDIAAKYGSGMTNHIHLEVRQTPTGQIIEPTNLF